MAKYGAYYQQARERIEALLPPDTEAIRYVGTFVVSVPDDPASVAAATYALCQGPIVGPPSVLVAGERVLLTAVLSPPVTDDDR